MLLQYFKLANKKNDLFVAMSSRHVVGGTFSSKGFVDILKCRYKIYTGTYKTPISKIDYFVSLGVAKEWLGT